MSEVYTTPRVPMLSEEGQRMNVSDGFFLSREKGKSQRGEIEKDLDALKRDLYKWVEEKEQEYIYRALLEHKGSLKQRLMGIAKESRVNQCGRSAGRRHRAQARARYCGDPKHGRARRTDRARHRPE